VEQSSIDRLAWVSGPRRGPPLTPPEVELGRFLQELASLYPAGSRIEYRPLAPDGEGDWWPCREGDRVPRPLWVVRAGSRYCLHYSRVPSGGVDAHVDVDGHLLPLTLEEREVVFAPIEWESTRVQDWSLAEQVAVDPREALAFIIKHSFRTGRNWNAFLGCQPRRAPFMGGNDDVVEYVVLAFDLDVGEGKAYSTLEDATQSVRDFHGATGIGPTVLVASGGGLHVWYFLKEPVPRREESRWRAVVASMCCSLKSDEKALDPARILRPPSTWNCNPRRYPEPRPVQILEDHYDRRVAIAEFEDALGLDWQPDAHRTVDRATGQVVGRDAPWSGRPRNPEDLPADMPDWIGRLVEVGGLLWKPLPTVDGRFQGIGLHECPACHGGRTDERWKARITFTGRLKCWRDTCPAAGRGLPRLQWIREYMPDAYAVIDEFAADAVDPSDDHHDDHEPPDAGSPSSPRRLDSSQDPAVGTTDSQNDASASTTVPLTREQVLDDHRPELRRMIAEADTFGRADPRNLALLQDTLGAGKTAEALAFVEETGHGIYLTPDHQLRAEVQGRYRGPSAAREGMLRLCALQHINPEQHGQLVEAAAHGHNIHRACGQCPHRKTCEYHQQADADVVFGVHAHGPTLESKVGASPRLTIFDEEVAGLSTKTTVTCDELIGLTIASIVPEVDEAMHASPRRELIEALIQVLRVLEGEHVERVRRDRHEAWYPARTSGDELAERFIRMAGQQFPEVANNRCDGVRALISDLAMAEPIPTPREGELLTGRWRAYPPPYVDQLLTAVLNEMAGDPASQAILRRNACVATEVDGTTGQVRSWIEMREGNAAAITSHALILDGTADETFEILRRSLETPQSIIDGVPARNIRLFRTEVAEEPGAVDRHFIETTSFRKRNCMTRMKLGGRRGCGSAIGALEHALKILWRDQRKTKGLAVALITHKKLAIEIQAAWDGREGARPALRDYLAGQRSDGTIANLSVTWYRRQRGIDSMKTVDAIVLLGDPWTNWGEDFEEARRIGMGGMAMVLSRMRSEAIQALARIRPLLASATNRKSMFYFGSVDPWIPAGDAGSIPTPSSSPTDPAGPPAGPPTTAPHDRFAMPSGRRRSPSSAHHLRIAERLAADLGVVSTKLVRREAAAEVRRRRGGAWWRRHRECSSRTEQANVRRVALASGFRPAPGVGVGHEVVWEREAGAASALLVVVLLARAVSRARMAARRSGWWTSRSSGSAGMSIGFANPADHSIAGAVQAGP